MLVLGQQLVLALIMVPQCCSCAWLRFRRGGIPCCRTKTPAILLVFIFFFFFATPMLALLVLFGGRYFHSWRKTAPATIVILACPYWAHIWSCAIPRRPILCATSRRSKSSLKAREVNVTNYRQWVEANWLMSDAKFQRDYESYLRNGPGRWITSRIYAASDPKDPDAAWKREAIMTLCK